MSAIIIYILWTIVIFYVSTLILHFIVYGFFVLKDDWKVDPITGEEQPTFYNAYSSLVFEYLWKDLLLDKVAFRPFKSLRLLFKFFYDGYLRKKLKDTWLGEKVYLYFLKRKGFKMLKEMEKKLKQKRETSD